MNTASMGFKTVSFLNFGSATVFEYGIKSNQFDSPMKEIDFTVKNICTNSIKNSSNEKTEKLKIHQDNVPFNFLTISYNYNGWQSLVYTK